MKQTSFFEFTVVVALIAIYITLWVMVNGIGQINITHCQCQQQTMEVEND